MTELQSKISSKTKAIIYNNPNNPLGKVFTLDEITSLCNLVIDNDILMISDEVYEHMVFDDSKMIRLADSELFGCSHSDPCLGWRRCQGCGIAPSPSDRRERHSL